MLTESDESIHALQEDSDEIVFLSGITDSYIVPRTDSINTTPQNINRPLIDEYDVMWRD